MRTPRRVKRQRDAARILCLAIGVAVIGLTLLVMEFPPNAHAPTRQDILIGPLLKTSFQESPAWIRVSEGLVDQVSIKRNLRISGSKRDRRIGNGLYALPGLIDSHVHLPPTFLPGQLDFFLLMFLKHGVTSVRELGSPYLDVAALEREVQSGDRTGPRILGCGRPLTGSPSRFPVLEEIRDRFDLNQAIERRVNAGLKCVKIYRGFPAALMPRAAKTARESGLFLVGHLPRESPWDSTDLADIQHVCDPRCASLRPEGIDELVRAARGGGVRHTPTLVTVDNPLEQLTKAPRRLPDDRIPRAWNTFFWNPDMLAHLGVRGFLDLRGLRIESTTTRRATQALIQSGATLQVGTDTPFPFVVPGISVHEEMHLLNELGYPIDQVWAAATSTPGTLLSGRNLGQLVPGAPADILLFREDPTLSLDALSTLEFVIAGGRVYDVNELQALVAEQLEYLNGPVYRFGIEPVLRLALDHLQ